MIFSYTQISQYFRCPRSYRYRYFDGWQEKDTRAGMVFGRCFERALAAMFCQEDPAATLFREWEAYRDVVLVYKNGDSWDRLLHQGVVSCNGSHKTSASGFGIHARISR